MKEYIFKVSNIEWDTYDEEADKEFSQKSLGLPSSVNVHVYEDDFSDNIERLSEEELNEELCELIERDLMDTYGYLLNSYNPKLEPIKVNEY